MASGVNRYRAVPVNSSTGTNTMQMASVETKVGTAICAALSITAPPSAANPTASVGLATVNGAAATYMRSDAAPPLNQAIVPTWTGAHTWSPAAGTTAETINYPTGTGASNVVFGSSVATGNTTIWRIAQRGIFNWDYVHEATTGNLYFTPDGGTTKCPMMNGAGLISCKGVDMTPATGTFTSTFTGFTAGVTCTSTWTKIGTLVTLAICGGSGTSNVSTFTMTGLPSAIQPATLTQDVGLGKVSNGGATVSGGSALVTAATGTITFELNGSAGGWNASSTKGFATAGVTISYLLN